MKILIFSLFTLIFGLGMAFADPITPVVSEDKIHFIDEQIMVMADISNSQNIQQNFVYITHKK